MEFEALGAILAPPLSAVEDPERGGQSYQKNGRARETALQERHFVSVCLCVIFQPLVAAVTPCGPLRRQTHALRLPTTRRAAADRPPTARQETSVRAHSFLCGRAPRPSASARRGQCHSRAAAGARSRHRRRADAAVRPAPPPPRPPRASRAPASRCLFALTAARTLPALRRARSRVRRSGRTAPAPASPFRRSRSGTRRLLLQHTRRHLSAGRHH